MLLNDKIIMGVEISLSVLSLLFGGVLYSRRKCLQTVAQQNCHSYSKKIKNVRIIAQIFNQLAYISLLVLQLSLTKIIVDDSDNDLFKLYCVLWLAPSIIGFWQIKIEILEFKTKTPLMIYHKIYWGFQLLASLSVLVTLLVQWDKSDETIRFIAYFGRACIELFLVLFFLLKRQDIQEYMSLYFVVWDLDVKQMQQPLLSQPQPIVNDYASETPSNDSEISVQIQTSYTTVNDSLQFKMKVILAPRRSSSGAIFPSYPSNNSGSKEYTLTKEYSEFLQLQESLNEEIKRDIGATDSALHDIDEISILCSNNIQLEFEEINKLRNKLQEFMNILTQNPNFYYQSLIDFLKIQEMDLKQYYLELKRNNPKRINEQREQRVVQESIHNVTQSFNQERYCSEFFEVIFDKDQDNKAQLKLRMRYSELRQLHRDLNSKFENLPHFPQKKLISNLNPTFLNERMNHLKMYLCILLNEEEYHNQVVYTQLQRYATKFVENHIWEINPNGLYRCDYTQWQAESCGNFILMTDGESKGFTVYKFTIFENLQRRGLVEKRFKEFVKLHEFIDSKFSHQIENLPSLPPKISNFNTNIPKEKRQRDLQDYLNKLFKIKLISSCYFFRQFFSSVSQPLEILNLSQSPKSMNNPVSFTHQQLKSQVIDIDDEMNFRDQFENSNGQEGKLHLNSLQIDELQQYGAQLSPTNN